MESRFTFSQKLAGGFAIVVFLALTSAVVSIVALRDVVARKDEVIEWTRAGWGSPSGSTRSASGRRTMPAHS